MTMKIANYNIYRKKKFYIRFYFSGNNRHLLWSYERIYLIYQKFLKANKIFRLYTFTYNKNHNRCSIKIYFKEVDDIFFSVYFQGTFEHITIYKDKKEISIKNKKNDIKTYRVFTDIQIIYLMEKEGLNHTNSTLLTSDGVSTIHFEETAEIDYGIIKKKEKNIFELFSLIEPEDKKFLSLNFDSYFSCLNFKYIHTTERKLFYSYLENYVEKNYKGPNILFLTGKPGIGKSISLLYFLSQSKYKHCYFDMNNLDDEYLYNESFQLFSKNDFSLYKNYFVEIKSMREQWEKIEFIISKSSNYEKKIIIIDHYKSLYDEGFKNLKKLGKYFPNCRFVICLSYSNKRSNTFLYIFSFLTI